MKKARTFVRPLFLVMCLLSIIFTSFTDPATPTPSTPVEQSGQFITPEVEAMLTLGNAQIFSTSNIQDLLQHPKAKALKVKYSSDHVALVAVDESMKEINQLQLSFGIQPNLDVPVQPVASVQ